MSAIRSVRSLRSQHHTFVWRVGVTMILRWWWVLLLFQWCCRWVAAIAAAACFTDNALVRKRGVVFMAQQQRASTTPLWLCSCRMTAVVQPMDKLVSATQCSPTRFALSRAWNHARFSRSLPVYTSLSHSEQDKSPFVAETVTMRNENDDLTSEQLSKRFQDVLAYYKNQSNAAANDSPSAKATARQLQPIPPPTIQQH
jgi:hypothetical protein